MYVCVYIYIYIHNTIVANIEKRARGPAAHINVYISRFVRVILAQGPC